MTGDLDYGSYKKADVGETYEISPQVNSRYMRTTYSRLIQVSDAINYNSPIFTGMHKRNRSLGSTQAFIVEIALADKRWVDENLKPFCIGNGVGLLLGEDYMDNVYFDRLAAYNARSKKNTKTLPSPLSMPLLEQYQQRKITF